MTTQRKPKAPTPHEVGRGGRVYLVEGGKIWEGRKSGEKWCKGCETPRCTKAHVTACHNRLNGGRGHRTLHPVQAVG